MRWEKRSSSVEAPLGSGWHGNEKVSFEVGWF
jgi:hypothetical protein